MFDGKTDAGIQPHQTQWEEQAAQEIAALKQELGTAAQDIQHVGSTAVRGLCAQPVLDYLVGLAPQADKTAFDARMESLGYLPAGQTSEGYWRYDPEKLLAGKFPHRVWAAPWGRDLWQDSLWLRDRLCHSPALRVEYERIRSGPAVGGAAAGDYVRRKRDFLEMLLPARTGQIRRLTDTGWEEAGALCLRTFLEFEALDYEQQGIDTFRALVQPDMLRQQSENGVLSIWGYYARNRLLGVAGVRLKRHISLLFVDKRWHHMGIGHKLALHAMAECKKEEPEMTVHSSPYAIGFYESLGFEATGCMRTVDGITFLPMCIQLGDKSMDEM